MSSSATVPNRIPAPRALEILILGGTGFIGPHQWRCALARGHRVTLFNRGKRPAASADANAIEVLYGDRDRGNYTALAGRRFDVCIDNSASVPAWVRGAATVLAGHIDHHVFISTVSVYASHETAGQDESAPRAAYDGPDAMTVTAADLRLNMAWYGPLKALCEDEVQRRFCGISTVVRPGLIVGPGDETDRFTYWPLRLRRGGPLLVPPLHDPVMLIDVRDLAEWTIHLAEQRLEGPYNAVGPAEVLTMGEMLRQVGEATGRRARLIEASQAFLDAHQVAPWSELPVWLPGHGDTAGFHRRSHTRALQAGLRFRPLAQTTADLLAWWDTLDDMRRATLRAGLGPEREAELLARL